MRTFVRNKGIGGILAFWVVGCGSTDETTSCGAGMERVGGECVAIDAGPRPTYEGIDVGNGGTSGGGGAPGSGGAGGAIVVPPACPNPRVLPAENYLVADFEDGLDGFYGWSDQTGEHFGPVVEAVTGMPALGGYAAHIWGTGNEEFGGGTSLIFENCIDLSNVDGVTFWARGTLTIRFSADQPSTQPFDSGGECLEGCYDHYGAWLELTEEWQQFSFRWEELAQAGWGTAVSFEHVLVSLAFTYPADPTNALEFEYWFDEVVFFKDPPPTGEGGAGGGG